MYGCLNPQCKKSLGSTFQGSLLILIGYCFKLTVVSILSVGLSAHTARFSQHYSVPFLNVLVSVIFLVISAVGFASIWTFEAESLRVNPQVNWSLVEEGPFPFFENEESLTQNNSGWYSMTKLELVENCITQEKDCKPLVYDLYVHTINGYLDQCDTGNDCTEYLLTGTADIVNQALRSVKV